MQNEISVVFTVVLTDSNRELGAFLWWKSGHSRGNIALLVEEGRLGDLRRRPILPSVAIRSHMLGLTRSALSWRGTRSGPGCPAFYSHKQSVNIETRNDP